MQQPRGADVVLVNPGARTQIYQSLGTRLTAVQAWVNFVRLLVPFNAE